MTGSFARKAVFTAMGALFFAGLFAPQALAIPAFARKYKVACSECHAAWPLLNSTGRKFKQNGYKFRKTDDPGSILSDLLQFDKQFPGAVVFESQPYDKVEGGERNNRALEAVHLMAAGAINKKVSGFLELEGESDEGFQLAGSGWVTYHAAPFFNVTFGYGKLFMTDPYDTLGGRALTRGRNVVISSPFGGADANGSLKSNRQVVSVSGRLLDRLFYSASYSGIASDFEGDKASNLSGRVMFDVLPDQVMIGGFAFSGECQAGTVVEDEGIQEEVCAIKRDFDRFGIDAQVEVADAIFHGAFVHARDDVNEIDVDFPMKEKNNAWYFEGIYVFRRPDAESPWIVPSLRIEGFERNNGMQDFTALTANVSYYLYENVKIFGEWYKEVNVPTGFQKGGRFTIQAAVGF